MMTSGVSGPASGAPLSTCASTAPGPVPAAPPAPLPVPPLPAPPVPPLAPPPVVPVVELDEGVSIGCGAFSRGAQVAIATTSAPGIAERPNIGPHHAGTRDQRRKNQLAAAVR